MSKEIVEIIWNDSQQMRGWQDKDKYLPCSNTVHTVGFFLEEDDHQIVVSDSISEYQYNNPFLINKSCIISMKKYKSKSNLIT